MIFDYGNCPGAFKINGDTLFIYDGDNISNKLITKIPGAYMPPTITYTSSERSMFIRFRSDNVTDFRCFNMTFISVNQGTYDITR
jgi:CUB domain